MFRAVPGQEWLTEQALTVRSHVSKINRGGMVIISFLSLGSKALLIFVPISNVSYTLNRREKEWELIQEG